MLILATCFQRYVIIFLMMLITHSKCSEGETPAETEDTVRTITSSLIHDKAMLPCDVRSSLAKDRPVLVLWYKDTAGTPIYSFDARETNLADGVHWSHERLLGKRGVFRFGSKASHRRPVGKPFKNEAAGAYLELFPVSTDDEGVFRCRVDFLKSPTRNTVIQFTVVVPPQPPQIFNETSFRIGGRTTVATVIGPYNEGDPLLLHCHVTGGSPIPSVTWLVNEEPVVAKPVRMIGNVVRSTLVIEKLKRTHLHASLECRTSNYNKTAPLSTTVTLDLNFRPLNVSIRRLEEPMVAGNTYELICDSYGSRPSAVISWWKGGTIQMEERKMMTSHDKDTSTSVLRYLATTSDNQKYLTCRAENPSIYSSAKEDGLQLNILYRPVVTLQMGSNLDPKTIKEGDDVYFECHINANPDVSKVIWVHNGVQLHNDPNAGILVQNQSLVLQYVRRETTGKYTCQALNSQGGGTSNSVTLKIMYKPYCRRRPQNIFGASLHEPISVTCEVDARPGPVTFRWTFNNTSEHLPISSSAVLSDDLTSTAVYIPKEPTDYGTILCWAFNSIGEQSTPCAFSVIPAAVPEPLSNCSIANQTTDTIEIECDPGFDGGMTQAFLMEVYNSRTEVLYQNLSSLVPSFSLRSFQPGIPLLMVIYASNSKGRSKATRLETFTFKIAEKRTSPPTFLEFTPVIGMIVGTILALLLTAVIIVVIMKVKRPANLPDDAGDHHYSSNKGAFGDRGGDKMDRSLNATSPVSKGKLPTKLEEADPDVIPQNNANKLHLEPENTKQINIEHSSPLLGGKSKLNKEKPFKDKSSAVVADSDVNFVTCTGGPIRRSAMGKPVSSRPETSSVLTPLLNMGSESVV